MPNFYVAENHDNNIYSNKFGTNVMHDKFITFIENNTLVNACLSHEYYFIMCLKSEILNNENIATLLIYYCFQYDLSYQFRFTFSQFDPLATVLLECDNILQRYQMKFMYGLEDDELDNQLIKFGEIATDFLIRYCNYSLIRCMGQKIILTGQDNCQKKFEDYLRDGYILLRRKRVYFHLRRPWEGHFEYLPLLPTRESYFPIDELIEVERDCYQKVYYSKS